MLKPVGLLCFYFLLFLISYPGKRVQTLLEGIIGRILAKGFIVFTVPCLEQHLRCFASFSKRLIHGGRWCSRVLHVVLWAWNS